MEDIKPEELAKHFHTIYETLAPKYNYNTRHVSKVDWTDVPKNNKDLMIATCKAISKLYNVTKK